LQKSSRPSAIQQLIAGVINRQTRCILLDPCAKASYTDANKVSEWKSDFTDMKPGVHERKWEVDSLCYPIRLACGCWKISKDAAPFDQTWIEAITKSSRRSASRSARTAKARIISCVTPTLSANSRQGHRQKTRNENNTRLVGA
jgi:meiotically up-regulated gene 157 (Mug157) protein